MPLTFSLFFLRVIILSVLRTRTWPLQNVLFHLSSFELWYISSSARRDSASHRASTSTWRPSTRWTSHWARARRNATCALRHGPPCATLPPWTPGLQGDWNRTGEAPRLTPQRCLQLLQVTRLYCWGCACGWGLEQLVGSVLGSLSCLMQHHGFDPPLRIFL